MFDGLLMLGQSLARFSDPLLIAYALGATLLGIVVGVIPGLSATLVIALLTTLTIKQPPAIAILVLVCAYVGAIYGGSRTAILLNIPGTAANAASCIDGHQLALRGEAGRAMGISTTGSVMGSLFGVMCLAVLTPTLGEMALKFGAFEYFWLALLGVLMSGSIAGGDPLKGWLMGLAGLVAALVGQDGMHAVNRMTFGVQDLEAGISLIPALVGAFGFSEVLIVLASRAAPPLINAVDSVLPRLRDVFVYWRTIIRSGTIGVLIGILPGVGEDVASWTSYAAARRASREKAQFGKGSVEGLMAAETADNAAIPGAIIPALSLGVPGSAPSAVLMAAMIIHGAQPGPMLMVNQPQFIYEVVTITLVATLSILVFGLVMVRPLVHVLRVPRSIIMPIIFVLCVVGAFSIASRLFDVYLMLGIGVLAFLLRRAGYPVAPFVLGLVLGDILDKSLRRGLMLTDGDPTPFFTRPISAVLATTAIVSVLLLSPAVRRRLQSLLRARPWAIGRRA